MIARYHADQQGAQAVINPEDLNAIVGVGWHPFLRINRQGTYRPVGESTFRGLSSAVGKGAAGWKGRVVCFATAERQWICTLLARWDPTYTDP
jgi:hypothetical protein